MSAHDFSAGGTHPVDPIPNSHTVAGRPVSAARPTAPDTRHMPDALLAEVARGRTSAKPGSIPRGHVIARIVDLRRDPYWSRQAHALANMLESFYLRGKGSELLR